MLEDIGNFSLWTKVFFFAFAILILIGIIRYTFRIKVVKSFQNLPDDNRESLITNYGAILKIYKVIFWLSPVTLVCTPLFMYFYHPSKLLPVITIIALVYFYVLEDFWFKNTICGQLKKRSATNYSSNYTQRHN